jgi:predicted membrane chloride channel (bestrophin family)
MTSIPTTTIESPTPPPIGGGAINSFVSVHAEVVPMKRRKTMPHPNFASEESNRPRYRFGQRCCGCYVVPECCGPMKFVIGLFNCKGTVMLHSLPQMIMAVVWAFAVKYIHSNIYPIVIPAVFWSPLYTVTIFLGVFRTNLAFQQYKEGRVNLGKMMASLSNAVRFCVSINNTNGNSVDVDRCCMLTNTVAAMIRIDLRESRLPFGTKKGQRPNKQWKNHFNSTFRKSGTSSNAVVAPAAFPVDEKTNNGSAELSGVYWADNDYHGSPRISDLLTLDEIQMYSKLTPGQRVIMSTTLLMKEFASSTNTIALATLEDHIITCTTAWRGCGRIIDSPMPFSYGHLFHLMLFITFVFGTPIAIMSNENVGYWGVLLCWFGTFLTYGLEEMASEIENPFGWDVNDQ